jgi:hypothetical protein
MKSGSYQVPSKAGGLVADGELVVAGGDGAVALEPVDPVLGRSS